MYKFSQILQISPNRYNLENDSPQQNKEMNLSSAVYFTCRSLLQQGELISHNFFSAF